MLAAGLSCPVFSQTKDSTGLLSNDRIIAMLRNGTSENIILSLIERFPDKLDSGPDALVRLRSAGASNTVLLAVRRAALSRSPAAPTMEADEQPAPAAPDDAGTEDEDTAGLVRRGAYGTREKRSLLDGGTWNIGLGYPFLAVKYDFADYALETRFITRRNVSALAARGYLDFYRLEKFTAYTGLEAGYVRFGTAKFGSNGWELAGFLGGKYPLGKDLTASLDVAPTLIVFPGGGTHFDIGDIGWYVNLAVFFRLPAVNLGPKSAIEADASNTAALQQQESDSELAAWRRPVKARNSYADYLAAAGEALAKKDYSGAEGEYTRALASLPGNDKRRVFLYERRGWVALKLKDLPKARDFYLAAVTAAKQMELYDKDTINAYCGLAYCFEKLENIPLAIKNYERALDLTANAGVKREIEKTIRRLQAALPQDTGN